MTQLKLLPMQISLDSHITQRIQFILLESVTGNIITWLVILVRLSVHTRCLICIGLTAASMTSSNCETEAPKVPDCWESECAPLSTDGDRINNGQHSPCSIRVRPKQFIHWFQGTNFDQMSILLELMTLGGSALMSCCLVSAYHIQS